MADPLNNNKNSRHSLLPSFLYSSSSSMVASGYASSAPSSRVVIAAPREKVEMYSAGYYVACGVAGMLATGPTHMAVTPMDVVKCNMQKVLTKIMLLILTIQIDPIKYKSVTSGFGVLLKEQGIRGLFKGWAPTLIGYSAQGAGKYGLYEFFKKYYTDIAGPEYAAKYKTLIYLAGSASAEVIADVALCPMEAVKVRVQTQPGFARGLADGLPKIIKSEGALGFESESFQVVQGACSSLGTSDTMMKFAAFENTIELMYKHVIPTPKEQCSKPLQLGVSFASGYIAGVFCAVVSHPADNLVSFLNNAKGATVGDFFVFIADVLQAVKKLGLLGLFTRGLPLRIFMIGTLSGGQWALYDAFKVLLGLPTTGGPAPAATELAKA
ncbi:phosphate transporter 3 [Prunus dulcis]|uniref:Phosphate transporter 3 n=1 Tax=Prunus dulcis TaxID=3755 RepID=A0A4Y1RI88_PRUDU|nr:phosphate transporter 3 [Prunus dulcis]